MAHHIEITEMDDQILLLDQTYANEATENEKQEGSQVDYLFEIKEANGEDQSGLQTNRSAKQIFDERFKELNNRSTKPSTIFRVTVGLSESNPDAYKPKLISIGPYHNNNPQLRFMEKYKLMYLQRFLRRKEGIDIESCISELEKLKDEALMCYDDLEDLHSDNNSTGSCRFLQMLLLDGCFVVEYIRERCGIILEGEDTIIKGGCIDNQVRRDLLLLENQLPFFLLTKLHDMTKEVDEKPFTIMAKYTFLSSLPKITPASFLETVGNAETIKHLLHIVHMSCHPSGTKFILPSNRVQENTELIVGSAPMQQNTRVIMGSVPEQQNTGVIVGSAPVQQNTGVILGSTPVQRYTGVFVGSAPVLQNRGVILGSIPVPENTGVFMGPAPVQENTELCEESPIDKNRQEWHDIMRNATELCEAGVSFTKVGTIYHGLDKDNFGDKTSLFDIKFENGLMKIPCFQVVDDTETILRNLIAFEQQSSTKVHPAYFCDYAVFMDRLIDSERDVNLLCQKGIIRNRIGEDKEVASIFNKIGKGVAVSSVHFYYKEECRKAVQHYEKPWNRMKANLRHNYFHSPWAGLSTVAAIILLLLTTTQTVLSFISTIK